MKSKKFLNFTIYILIYLLLLCSVQTAQLTDFEIFPEKKEFSIDDNLKDDLILLKAFMIHPTDSSASILDPIGGIVYPNFEFRVNLFNF
jgi:hypothetical protein